MSRLLAEQGCTVVICGRDAAALDAYVDELRAAGRRAERCIVDVGDPASVRRGVDSIVAKHGLVDVLVNCAGVVVRADAAAYTDEEWRQVVDTDLNGPFWCSRAVAPQMLASRRGVIVNVGSIAAVTGISGRASYTAAKAGLSGLPGRWPWNGRAEEFA